MFKTQAISMNLVHLQENLTKYLIGQCSSLLYYSAVLSLELIDIFPKS